MTGQKTQIQITTKEEPRGRWKEFTGMKIVRSPSNSTISKSNSENQLRGMRVNPTTTTELRLKNVSLKKTAEGRGN